jgi:hypothetical protein
MAGIRRIAMIDTIVAMALVTWVIALAMAPAWLGPVSVRAHLLERWRRFREQPLLRSRLGLARAHLSILA